MSLKGFVISFACALTTTVLGPDDVCSSPETCRSHRACFEND